MSVLSDLLYTCRATIKFSKIDFISSKLHLGYRKNYWSNTRHLIWLHFSCWLQIWQWKLIFLKEKEIDMSTSSAIDTSKEMIKVGVARIQVVKVKNNETKTEMYFVYQKIHHFLDKLSTWTKTDWRQHQETTPHHKCYEGPFTNTYGGPDAKKKMHNFGGPPSDLK